MSASIPLQSAPALTFNAEAQQILEILETTSAHLLLMGRAGTGKATLLQHFCNTTSKKLAVLAPTGVAAVNVGGQTIRSFFGFRPGITLDKVRARSRGQGSIYTRLDMVILDEISMVRADLLDCIEKFLRLNGRFSGRPFGGIQMVFIGDLYQLPPVVPEDEQELFETVYASPYFFDARAYARANVRLIELTAIYRQRDPIFVELLDALRTDGGPGAATPPGTAICAHRYAHCDLSQTTEARNRSTTIDFVTPAKRGEAHGAPQPRVV